MITGRSWNRRKPSAAPWVTPRSRNSCPCHGLYRHGSLFGPGPADFVKEAAFFEEDLIIAGPGRVAELQADRLLDARLSQLGLDEVTQQHFKIPVTASDGVIDLMHRAVASDWPNDYPGSGMIAGVCASPGAVLDDAETANLHAYFEAGREYGVY